MIQIPISFLRELFSAGLRNRVIGFYGFLGCFNAGAWIWAFLAFHDKPVLLATAFLAYTLGLRHAVDADHIAAIDNVTRKLMQEGKRPLSVGFFFSLGHSTIVVVASLVLYLTATVVATRLDALKGVSGLIGTSISAFFLIAIALVNIVILGVSGKPSKRYGREKKPIRKLYYNLTITFVSVIVALMMGGIEAIGVLKDQLNLTGGFWDFIGSLNDNFGTLGFVIIGVFVLSWAGSVIIYRQRI
jgi:high-affinity nickel permease